MLVLPDPSAVLYDLVQGQDQIINVSVLDSDGVAPDLSGVNYSANFTLYEKLGGGQISYLTSADTKYNGSPSIVLQNGGTPTWINAKIKFDETNSNLILSTSRRRNNVLLYGDLRVIHATGSRPLYVKQLKFSFRQTLQGA
jgi:hypothetical protein